MKRKLVTALIFCSVIIYFSYAGGGGGSSGGGGNNKSGGGGGGTTPPNWVTTSMSKSWSYAYLPQATSCGILGPFGFNSNNTYPNVTTQTIYNTNSNYYGKIEVQDLTTLEMRSFAGGVFGTDFISVPSNHTYRIWFDLYESCKNCMSPSLINLPSGQGRRIWWSTVTSFGAYSTYPIIYPKYNGLKNCQ